MLTRLVLGLAVLSMLSAAAPAQQRGPWPSEAFNRSERRHVAGKFDYYVLALSWSPTHCMTAVRGKDDMQCAGRDGRRYGFILHGLWPQYEKGYPLRCATPWRPFVPEPVIASMTNIMPSRGLIIHEYRQHGTCSGLRPAAYFALSRQLYRRINIPERYQNPFEIQFVSPQEVLRDFLRANPALKPDMIVVSCSRRGNRLREVRICMTRDGRPRTCSASATPRQGCRRASKMHVPPVRSTWRGGNDSESVGDPLLRHPRVIESPGRF